MNKVKLGDIADIITGPFGSMLHKSDYVEDGTPVIMPQDIGDRTISFEGIARVGTDDAERLSRYATIAEDIVYARRGDVEKHAFITKDQAGALCGTGCLRVRIDPEKANPLYVSFALKELSSRVWIRRHAVGSNMPNINTDILSDLPLDLPNLEEQRLVAGVLSALDEKIALNKRMMTELEETAALIYDYWFTQFDFPDENGRPYRSSGGKMVYNETLKREIPAGWEVVPLTDLFSLQRGYSYSSNELEDEHGFPMINLASIDRNRLYRSEELKFVSGSVVTDRTVRPGDLLIACTDLTRNADIVGSPVIVPRECSQYIYSMDLAKVDCDVARTTKAFIYEVLRTDWFHSFIKGHTSGTNVIHLDVDAFRWYRVAAPPLELQQALSNVIEPLFSEIDFARLENVACQRMRDWLLPMLMNGQVTVGM